MRGFKRAAAALLPAFAASLVLPADRAVRADYASPEGPASWIPFVYEYHVKNEAFIRFSLQSNSHSAAFDDPEAELISVVVPASDALGCSPESNTHIQVNGQTLVSTSKVVLDGQVVQRSGSQASLGPNGPTSSWDLQCACLDETVAAEPREDCQQVGYLLNFHLPTSAEANPDGFTLSFTQASEPKLLHLTSLALKAMLAVKPSLGQLKTSGHWLAPLLHPIDTIIGQVPTSTLSQILPIFSTTTERAFRTVTTPVAALTPRPSEDVAFQSVSLGPSPPSMASEDLPAPTLLAHDELDDSQYDVLDEHIHRHDGVQYQGKTVKMPSILLDEAYRVHAEATENFAAAIEHSHRMQSPVRSEECCSLQNFKKAFYTAGTRAQKALHTVVDHFVQVHEAVHQKMPLAMEKLRNETRSFHETYNSTLTDLPAELDAYHSQHVLVFSIVCFLLMSSTIFACIRYRDPRRRAERAARREERLNRRLYKNAYCKHKFQQFLDRLRGRETYQPQSQTFARAQTQTHTRNPSRDSDLEWHEKNSAVTTLNEPGVAMQKEITNLRDAHGFVENILRATSGMYRSAKRASSRSSLRAPRRRYSDAASEKSLLPPYSPDVEDEEILVVDGLHFSIATRRRRDTPASSIIDTSPRESDCGSSDGGKD